MWMLPPLSTVLKYCHLHFSPFISAFTVTRSFVVSLFLSLAPNREGERELDIELCCQRVCFVSLLQVRLVVVAQSTISERSCAWFNLTILFTWQAICFLLFFFFAARKNAFPWHQHSHLVSPVFVTFDWLLPSPRVYLCSRNRSFTPNCPSNRIESISFLLLSLTPFHRPRSISTLFVPQTSGDGKSTRGSSWCSWRSKWKKLKQKISKPHRPGKRRFCLEWLPQPGTPGATLLTFTRTRILLFWDSRQTEI